MGQKQYNGKEEEDRTRKIFQRKVTFVNTYKNLGTEWYTWETSQIMDFFINLDGETVSVLWGTHIWTQAEGVPQGSPLAIWEPTMVATPM